MTIASGAYVRSIGEDERWLPIQPEEVRWHISQARYLQVDSVGVRLDDIEQWRYDPANEARERSVLMMRHRDGWTDVTGRMADEVYAYLARGTVLIVEED